MNAFVRITVKLALSCWYSLSFEGVENIPQDHAVIFASNHRSYVDPVVLTIPVKLPMTYMAKEELFKKKLFGALISSVGAFPVSRNSGDFSIIDKAAGIISSGKNLIIFPEGTRSRDGTLGKGKSGVALIAAKSGADVVPCAVIFQGEKLKFRSKIVVKYGEVIPSSEISLSEDSSPRDVKKIKTRIMAEIAKLL